MTKLLACAVAAICLVAGTAAAETVTGTVRAWSADQRTVTLDNGQDYVLRHTLAAEGIAQGARVELVVDEQPGALAPVKWITGWRLI